MVAVSGAANLGSAIGGVANLGPANGGANLGPRRPAGSKLFACLFCLPADCLKSRFGRVSMLSLLSMLSILSFLS